jgi:hypothetical protein
MFMTLDGTTPGLFHYDYISENLFSVDTIIIKHSDTSYQRNCITNHPAGATGSTSCSFKIGIYSILGADYTLRLASTLATETLPLGVSTRGSVGIHDYNIYKGISL